MQIIEKYYDKNWKLKNLENKNNKSDSTLRLKRLKNGKFFPCCDFHGNCTNVAYAEVYPFMMKNSKKRGWNYLCKKHYLQEQKRLKWKLPASLKVEW